MIIAPGGGFDSADQYYAAAQPGPKLVSIQRPVTIVAAADDPVVPTPPLKQYACSSVVERVIIPTTWRENGAGAFGDLGPFSYRTYIVAGLTSSGFSSTSAINW